MGHLALRVAATYWLIKCSNDSKPLHSPSSYIRQVYAKAPTSVADLKVVLLTRVEGSDFRVFSRLRPASVSAHHRSMWAPHRPLRPGIVASGTP